MVNRLAADCLYGKSGPEQGNCGVETGKVMSLIVWRKMKPSWHER
jgi:hypothetical protein